MQILVLEARLAFPNLYKARPGQNPGDKAKFSALLIVDPTTKIKVEGKALTIAQMDPLFDKVGNDKWGDKAAAIMKAIRATNKLCLKDGAEKATYEGFADHLFISANSENRPTVFDRNRIPIDEASGKVYAGCYVNASIELWAQDNKFGKRINSQLRGVQFVRDGDAFAAGSSASEDEFEDLAYQGDDTDPTA